MTERSLPSGLEAYEDCGLEAGLSGLGITSDCGEKWNEFALVMKTKSFCVIQFFMTKLDRTDCTSNKIC